MRQDEHKRALFVQSKELLKFDQVTEDEREVLEDPELYSEGDQADIKVILDAL